VVNEVLSHTDYPFYDSIELYNPTANAISLGGWYLSDAASDLKKFRIPDGATIGAGQYLVYDDRDFNVAPCSANDKGFSYVETDTDGITPMLHLAGDKINELTMRRIVLPAGAIQQFVDHVSFGAVANGSLLDYESDTSHTIRLRSTDSGVGTPG